MRRDLVVDGMHMLVFIILRVGVVDGGRGHGGGHQSY